MTENELVVGSWAAVRGPGEKGEGIEKHKLVVTK